MLSFAGFSRLFISCYLQFFSSSLALRTLDTSSMSLFVSTTAGCDKSDLLQGAEILGISPANGSFGKDQLAHALPAPEAEVQELWQRLGLPSDRISLKRFCEATMALSPRILHERVPGPDLACLDRDCVETLNVSISKLLETGLEPPPESKDLVLDGTPEVVEDGILLQKPKGLLRQVLQRFFDIYPSQETSFQSTSLLQPSRSASDSRPDPNFHPGGFLITDRAEKEFTKSALLATRWVVEAMEIVKQEYNNDKLNELFKGWFKSASDQVKNAVSEHLFNIYMVLIYTRVVKAPSKDPQCKTQRNMAYVSNHCPQKQLPYLQSNPCGERYQFSDPQQYVIHICPIAWQSPSMFHVGNIIHEASHHYGTKDLAYGMKACLDLSTPQAAVSNADQYVYFIQHVMAVKYSQKMMRSYRGQGKGDHEIDQKVFSLPLRPK
eukprot:Skav203230  [mRNA]  locus=scaffold2292:408391:409701:+ [translate_table: standard]